MAVQIQLRHDIAANWTTANSVLAVGELGIETDTLKAKIGNGATAWNSLPYGLTATVPFAHTPFGPDTATVSGSLTIPTGYSTLKATGIEDFLGMSPGSLQAGDIFYLTLASGRIVRNGGSVVSPVVPFSMANGDLTAPAGAQLTWQLGPGGTQWNLKGAV
jgi:hypothetical protein